MTSSNGGGSRDDGRFDALYRKHYGRVYRYFRGAGVADDEAQDLAQETFRKIYEKFEQNRGEGDATFVKTTAKNVLLNRVRDRSAQKRSAPLVFLDDPELTFDVAAPAEPDYADRQEAERRQRQVAAAIEDLTPGQRECLKLRMEGLQYNEIAKKLAISEDAVKSRLRDALRFLRAQLGEKS